MDQRSADEGRSFATKKGGGSRLGEQLFGKNVTLYSDPNDPLVPGSIYSDDGQPAQKQMWIETGVLKNLQCSRYWAKKMKLSPIPSPTSLTLAGGTATTDDLIKQVKRGLPHHAVSGTIREVDPQTVLLTGLTRDGVFSSRTARSPARLQFPLQREPRRHAQQSRGHGPERPRLRRGIDRPARRRAAVCSSTLYAVERVGRGCSFAPCATCNRIAGCG